MARRSTFTRFIAIRRTTTAGRSAESETLRRAGWAWSCALALCLAPIAAERGAAHRLDEYLQAIRIDLELERVVLHVDLTPGAEISQSVVASLDGNGDGEIAAAEADRYAAAVLSHLTLAIDGELRPLTRLSFEVPSVSEMTAGTGVIRIMSSAAHSVGAGGPHTLELHNDFRPDVGAYLVNALVPSASEIRVTGQRRDSLQRTLTLEYEVAGRPGTIGRLLWSAAAAAIIGMALWARRHSRSRDATLQTDRTRRT